MPASLALTAARADAIQQHVKAIAADTPPAPVEPVKSPLTSPAYWLAIIPVIDLIAATFFHRSLHLGDNSAQWAVLAASIVGFGAFISRAVKHHSNGKVRAAWLAYLTAIVQGASGLPVGNNTTGGDTPPAPDVPTPDVPPLDPAEDPSREGGKRRTASTVDPSRLRTGMPSTTRAAKKTARGRRGSD